MNCSLLRRVEDEGTCYHTLRQKTTKKIIKERNPSSEMVSFDEGLRFIKKKGMVD